MRIEDRFTVSLPVDEAWKVFLDVERIAPCLPGAQLQEIDGEQFRGIVKVKLGAITAQFKGTARFLEVDESARRAVLRAEAREIRGQGNAAATVTATLAEAPGGGTEVAIDTDLAITGKVAQFGRSVMADISAKLLGEFARCLEADLAGGGATAPAATEPAAPAAPAPGPAPGVPASPTLATAPPTAATPAPPSTSRAAGTGPRTIHSAPVEPLDLLAVAGSSMAQRALPAGLAAVLLGMVLSSSRRTRGLLALLGAALLAALARSAAADQER